METLFIFPANHGKKLPALAGALASHLLDKAVKPSLVAIETAL